MAKVNVMVKEIFYAEGSLQDGVWEINTASLLTRLIQEAGRWCEYYASDLFIYWRQLEKSLEEGTYIFAFKRDGVDDASAYEKYKDNPFYYRSVWTLEVEKNGKRIEMRLSRKN